MSETEKPTAAPQPATTADALAGILAEQDEEDFIQSALEFVRVHLGMEVAYLSEFVDDNLVFRRVSAPGFEAMIAPGDSMRLDQVYCPHILEGRLPELIPDTAAVPFAQTIPLTSALPIGAHVSIPIRRQDGSNYGMFCCLSRKAQPTLNSRDLDVMRAFARLSAETINGKLSLTARHEDLARQIGAVMEDRAFAIAYQPIIDSETRRPKGFEALCRFKGEPYRSPDKWFGDASEVGLGIELEICVIEQALEGLNTLPADVYISFNASPQTVISGQLLDVFAGWPSERIVLELTEHEEVEDYDALIKQIDLLRYMGIRVAIDDAGAGYAGLQQIVRLRPDIIKLDMSLTSNVDKDVVRRALASALKQFARDTGALIVAEGVETEAELAALLDLEVELVQGYLLGKPGDLQAAVRRCGSGQAAAS